MLNFPAPRTQVDGKQEEYSALTAMTFDPDNDRTDQRFKDQVNLNHIVNRFGFDESMTRRRPTVPEVDDRVDLQQALDAQRALRRAFSRLPEGVREEYGSWEAVIAAYQSGDLVTDPQTGKLMPKPERISTDAPPEETPKE